MDGVIRKRWRRAQTDEADCWTRVPVADPGYLARKRSHWVSVLNRLPPDVLASKRVLDMGCGPSGILAVCDVGTERVGVDPLMDHYLRLNPSLAELPVTWLVGEVETYRPDVPFDLVFSANSLDHCYAPPIAASNLRACLREGGHAAVLVNIHRYRPFCLYYRATNRIIDPMHPHHWTAADVRHMLTRAGFAVIQEWDLSQEVAVLAGERPRSGGHRPPATARLRHAINVFHWPIHLAERLGYTKTPMLGARGSIMEHRMFLCRA